VCCLVSVKGLGLKTVMSSDYVVFCVTKYLTVLEMIHTLPWCPDPHAFYSRWRGIEDNYVQLHHNITIKYRDIMTK